MLYRIHKKIDKWVTVLPHWQLKFYKCKADQIKLSLVSLQSEINKIKTPLHKQECKIGQISTELSSLKCDATYFCCTEVEIHGILIKISTSMRNLEGRQHLTDCITDQEQSFKVHYMKYQKIYKC